MFVYYATAGRGTEVFVMEELKQKLQCKIEDILALDGKVFFSCPRTLTVLHLKSVERVFVKIFYNGSFRWNKKKGFRRWYDNLNQITTWESSLHTWKKIQEEIKAKKDIERTTSNIVNEKKCCHVADESDYPTDKALPNVNINSSEFPISIQTSLVNETKPQCLKRDYSKIGDGIQSEKITDKKQKLLNTDGSETSFRVSAKLSGNVLMSTSSQCMAQKMGIHIKEKTGWRTQKNWEIEICMQVTDHGLTIGLPITKEPLSKRPYLHAAGMRSTVAWIMGLSAKIQPGDIVLDPMCGSGTILVEAANEWKESTYIGIDNNPKQLQKSIKNVGIIYPNVSLCLGDATNIPFPLESIDRIVCDLPFGMKHNATDDLKSLYTKALVEMDRLLKVGGIAVLLTSSEMKEFLKRQIEEKLKNLDLKEWNMCSCGKYRKRSVSTCVVSNTVNGKENASIKSFYSVDHDVGLPKYSKSDHYESDKQLDNPLKPLVQEETLVNTDISESDAILKSGHQEHETQSSVEVTEKGKNMDKVVLDCGKCSDSCDYSKAFELCPKINCPAMEIPYVCMYSWILNKEHYLKLGETHSYMLVWEKRLSNATC